MHHRRVIPALLAALAVSGGSVVAAQSATAGASATASSTQATATPEPASATPIKHVVVIFQENVSFDHYFGTYPSAANTDGQPFRAAKGTPAIDELEPATSESLPAGLRHGTNLLYSNPNAAQPQRLDSSPTGLAGDAGGQLTCDRTTTTATSSRHSTAATWTTSCRASAPARATRRSGRRARRRR